MQVYIMRAVESTVLVVLRIGIRGAFFLFSFIFAL